MARIEAEIAATVARRPPPLGQQEREQLMALGGDLQRAWLHPAATAATRKRILRTALSEVIVRRDGAIIHAVLHWQGGDHTELKVKQRLNAVGRHNPRIPDDTIALMRDLARLMPDRQIALLLNRIKSQPKTAIPGRWSACAASASITRSYASAKKNGLSAAKSRSMTQRKSSGCVI